MGLTELREVLLEQHAELRRLAGTAAALAERARAGGEALIELRALLGRLGEAVEAHNAFEERQLAAILPTIDAWGPVRRDLMGSLHVEEHASILRAVADARGADGAPAVAATLAVIAEMTAHMEREENAFLRPDVLRDDIITSGVGG